MKGELLSLETTQKIARLEQENSELQNINDKLISALNSAENKISKTIEYIHNNQPVFELTGKEQLQEWFEKEYYKNLLNMLRGNDEKKIN